MGTTKRSKILKQAAQLESKKPLVKLTATEIEALGLTDDSKENAFLAFKYFQPEYQCFSEWQTDELRAFSQFIKKICAMTWVQIISSGGQVGQKQGLGCTVHKNTNKLPNQELLNTLSKDLTFMELRITDKARVHGFRLKSAFFLIWLDRNHDIYPQ